MTDAKPRRSKASPSSFSSSRTSGRSADEDERMFGADIDLAAIIRVAADLCDHDLSALADLVCSLHRLETQEPERAQISATPH
jgi:hypothetical protein